MALQLPKKGDALFCGSCLAEMGFVDDDYIAFASKLNPERLKELYLGNNSWLSYDGCE